MTNNILKLLLPSVFSQDYFTPKIGSAIAVVASVSGAAAAVGGAIGLTGIMADVVGGALIGGAISGVTGGNILTGAITGGIGGYASSLFSGAAGGIGTGLTSDAASTLGVNASLGATYTPSILTAGGMDMTTAGAAMGGLTGGVANYAPSLLTATKALGIDPATGLSLAGSMNSGGILGSITAGGYNPNSFLNKLVNPLSNVTGSTGQKTGAGNLASLVGAGMNIYSAMNAQSPQDPNAAKAGASPWSQYAGQAAQQLNALNNNPNLVYGLPGYAFQQQQGTQQVSRSGAAAGASLSGGTLAAINQQGQSTASDFFNNRVNQLSQMAGATPQNLVAGQQAYNVAQYNQSLAQANQANMLASGLAGLGQFFFS
jgi:hypothetical protein